MTANRLHILHLEDDPRDVELVQAVLESDGLDFRMEAVSTREDFVAQLDQTLFDLILSDFSLPSFDGTSAAEIARGRVPDVPFIFVSGMLGEDAAIECLRNGATDYVLKRHLARLAPAIRRAISESEEKMRRRAAELQLVKEQHFLRAVLDSLETGIVACDANGILTLFNRATREFHGLPQEPIPPGEWAAHYDLYHPDRNTLLDLQEIPLYRALNGEHVQNSELRIIPRKGRARTVLVSGQAIMDENGQRQGAVVALHDVTERKELEDLLRQSQKLEALGRLAGGVAHDFNNILTAVMGYSEIALRTLRPQDAVRGCVEEIQRSAERAAGLTRQLLAFGRKQMIRPTVLDVPGLLADMENMLHRFISEDISLVIEGSSAQARVKMDRTQVEQILVNLVINARDAMPRGGRLSIRTEALRLDDERLLRTLELNPGPYLLLEVADSGVGIPPELLPRIFEPFFTTKEPGRGTGLGLATVYGIVKQNSGAIDVSSEPGKGTCFRVYLPATQEKIVSEAVVSSPQPTGTETILVVEDESEVLALLCTSLRQAGYRVLSSSRPVEAIDMARRHQGEIHLLLTDVILPGQNGMELAAAIQSLRSGVSILYMSGHPHDIVSHQGALSSETAFLQKPFTMTQLEVKIREVLRGSVSMHDGHAATQ
ncbi:MAG: response regulator [Candidatus Polarisedimenticolia bacterium]